MTDEGQKRSQILNIIVDYLVFKKENYPFIIFRVILLCVAALLISLNWHFFDRKENYQVGRPSARTYFALTSDRYEDIAATLELRQRAASRIIDVMVQDEKIASEVSRRLDLLEQNELHQLFYTPLLNVYNKQNINVQKIIIKNALKIGKRVRDESTDREHQTSLIWKYLKAERLSQSERNIIFQMLDIILNPTLQSDNEMVNKLREDVSAQIPSVIKEIQPGAVLVQKGQIITPALALLLAQQGYPSAVFPWKHLLFILVVILIWSFWPVWITDRLRKKLSLRDWVYIAVVLSVVWLLEVIIGRLSKDYSMAVLGLTGWLCLTLPVSLSFQIIFGGGIISVLIAFGTNPGIVSLGCILSVFSACIGTILFFNQPSSRITIWRNLFILGLLLGGLSCIMHWGLGLHYTYTLPLRAVGFSALWGAIVVALLPLWENLFGIISSLRLLELSHLSQPLMKRLQMEAPGTYTHVIMVGTLAESAADKLGMNSLLVRAGAYYHDIGKLKNPDYFVENQRHGKNIHDDLPPSLSGHLLIAHVSDGLKIAEENNLPKYLHQFIREHHGTTVQKYFYEKAIGLGENVTEKEFQYLGPRPQSKETALVMFADSVEAAVKARAKYFESNEELEAFIEKVMQSKCDAKQLDDVDFSIKDLAVIRKTFAQVFQSTYHTREVKDVEQIISETKLKRSELDASAKLAEMKGKSINENNNREQRQR